MTTLVVHTDSTKETEMRWTRRRYRPRGDGHLIDNGAVGCPVRRADVNVERCLMCAAFETLEEVDGETYLYCRPVARHSRVSPEIL